jgi:hypothetical protein
VIEDLEIGCVQTGDGAAERLSNGESGLDQVGFGAPGGSVQRGRKTTAPESFAIGNY